MAELLPVCDLLFNIVSLAAYFCDLVFDLLVVYTLYRGGFTAIFVQCVCAIILTMLVTQVLSLKWYLTKRPFKFTHLLVLIVHLAQMGMLWRYARLIVPVELSTVKQQVRDLCILRLLHGFLQAAPMLLLQLSLLADTTNTYRVPGTLVVVSASLSLLSVCWSLASFSKHVQSVDRLILTWLGVMSQLLWRGGTVSSRAIALSAYAATHHSWIFLVLALHWSCTFLWLLSPRGPFHGQRGRRLGLCALVAGIYVLAYVNLHGKRHVRTMTTFYVVMLLENSLLVGVWMAAVWNSPPKGWILVPVLTVALFFAGLGFMLVYYRFFHVRRFIEKPAAPSVAPAGGGVFSCRFGAPHSNSNVLRKKKKPTSFVPPPATNGSVANGAAAPPPLGPIAVPFWRRPLPSSSENEGSSVGSRVNIHQKLQEKKQKQLAELKIIEEEIKQGKLVGPESADFDDRQPIPRTKKHVEPQLLSLASLNNLASYGVNLNRRPPPRAPRNRTPELLLTPRYLYCDCVGGAGGAVNTQPPSEPSELVGMGGGAVSGVGGGGGGGGGGPPGLSHHSLGSDLESQVSLPRSYTLPREFKYYRRQKMGRAIQPVASTNSSDGDVDSADDESDSNPPPPALVRPLRRPYRHETQL